MKFFKCKSTRIW